MTRTPTILGTEYDAPAQLAADLRVNGLKRALVRAQLERAEAAADEEAARLMWWELALIDLVPMAAEGVSPYRGGTYEQYAQFYHLTPDTVLYARERAHETRDLRFKLHYLEFVLLRSEPTGPAWVDLQREILTTYRDYSDGCRAGAGTDPHCFAGIYIDHALHRVGQLLSRRGLVPPGDLPRWAEWIVGLAEDSRAFPVERAEMIAQQRYRWVGDFLRHLTVMPPDATAPTLRTRALALLTDAAAYYESTPLNDNFAYLVAAVDAELRKYWGETHTHERMIRRQFEATLRRAEFHKSTGNGLLTATFYRQARSLVEQQRQYFTNDDVARLQRLEQEALDRGIQSGEFKRFGFSIEIPKELMDYVRETPEATVEAIVGEALHAVPNRTRLREDVLKGNEEAPLQALIARTVVAPGKVVGESGGPEGNVEFDVEFRAILQTQVMGLGVVEAVQKAAGKVGLTPDHLVAPLRPLNLDEGSVELVRRGCERLIAGDFVSATHILIPRIEDVLRQHLNAIGVDTTDYVRLGDGTSRTDDATLGSLLYKKLPDGRTVRDYLGGDLWDHVDSVLNRQTGLNLRNEFAHGLARPEHCTPFVAGVALLLLYQLAGAAAAGLSDGAKHGNP
jgi:uncharacterized protein DUF4209